MRISTRHESPEVIHRNWAIEHHLPPTKHCFPHLQFKFHTEEIGQFRIRIDIADQDEYRKVILGFIYQIKQILNNLETFKKGITEEILVLELVNQLEPESGFLFEKIKQGVQTYSLELDKGITGSKLNKLNDHPLLRAFLGKENMRLIQSSFNKDSQA